MARTGRVEGAIPLITMDMIQVEELGEDVVPSTTDIETHVAPAKKWHQLGVDACHRTLVADEQEAHAALTIATRAFLQKVKEIDQAPEQAPSAKDGGGKGAAPRRCVGPGAMEVDPSSAEERQTIMEDMAKTLGVDLTKDKDPRKRKRLEELVEGFTAAKRPRK